MEKNDTADRLSAAREQLVVEHLEPRPAPAMSEVTLGERLMARLRTQFRGEAMTPAHSVHDDARWVLRNGIRPRR